MPNTPTPTAADVRRWAEHEGIPVGKRGFLQQDVIDRFNKGRRGRQRYLRHDA